MDQERAVQLVRQHAETARLMGVDFVPVYRAGGGGGDEPVLAPSDSPQPHGTAAQPAVETIAVVEAKPRGGPGAGLTRQAALDALRARYEKECPHRDFVTQFTNVVFG